MPKEIWKPGNMLYPVPPVLVTCHNKKGESNMLTVAWAGTVCSTPAMLSISVRKERYSHAMLMETGEFVVNLPTEDLVWETDEAGVRSGRDLNKWESLHLHQEEGKILSVPMILECPVNMECKVKQVLELGSHDLFLAEIVAVHVDSALLDEKKRLQLEKAKLLAYSHGQYFGLGNVLGSFGFSVRKGAKKKSSEEKKKSSEEKKKEIKKAIKKEVKKEAKKEAKKEIKREIKPEKIREKRENPSFKKKKTGVKG